MKEQIVEVSKRLKDLHRRFLERERQQAEKYFERRISPFDFLQMLTHEQSFKWLQPFSALIAEIDAFADESEEVTQADLDCIREQIDFVLHKENPQAAIYHRYQHHLSEDPEFVLLHSSLRQALIKLDSGKKKLERGQLNGSGQTL
ncbi:hypothetical protein [Bdellovibrio sp. NC01]|uniref:hypothetical protein n=1 Tax=Bdellovibrio sp. NC01 TaxID=2220073 RepID=UPI00115B1334|nr:hypothetical protein [Bdellovibrio sp. NC01]QDK38133.1 hypothetical protein DOE51_11320 [Bdellovibrio sp. NC01]